MNDRELRIDHITDERLQEIARRMVTDSWVSVLTRFARDVGHVIECNYCVSRFSTIKRRTTAQIQKEKRYGIGGR